MEIGVGLPNAIRGVSGEVIVAFARRAEERGFSSLGTIDRIVFPNYEPLIALAAAAAVTSRIRLATTVLLGPLRTNHVLLAKTAATLDSLSGGRLVLGIGVGGRMDDFTVGGTDFAGRGRALGQQLVTMKRIWAGEGGVGPAPARPGGPMLIIGGSNQNALRRGARHAEGWIQGGGGPAAFGQGAQAFTHEWESLGRQGKPRLMALAYFSLGAQAEENARAALGDYYGFLPALADMIVAGAFKSKEALLTALDTYRQAGCDELILFPCSTDAAQVDALAEVVL